MRGVSNDPLREDPLSERPICIGVLSDPHCGSILGLCPPEGVHLEEGATYLPSPAQHWSWACYQEDLAAIDALITQHHARFLTVINGDLFDGRVKDTPQILSPHPEAQGYVGERVMGELLARKPEKVFLVRGTEAHVGPAGASEEAFAHGIHAERNPITDAWSWWVLNLECYGRLLDFRHHPGTHGKLPWTQPQGVDRLAFLIWSTHTLKGERAPDLAIRSHVHVAGDSHDAYPTRAIITPAYQLKTSYVHKVAPEAIPTVGMTAILVHPSGQIDVHKLHHKLSNPEPVRI